MTLVQEGCKGGPILWIAEYLLTTKYLTGAPVSPQKIVDSEVEEVISNQQVNTTHTYTTWHCQHSSYDQQDGYEKQRTLQMI